MNNYSKGKNEEEQWRKENIPISNLPQDFVWMHVSGGSKIKSLLDIAWKKFEDLPHMVWTASGPGVAKAITCAEITKRKFNPLKQKTQICYRSVKEYWDPKVDNLDQLVVTREVPAIHIYLYKDNAETR